MGYAIVVYCTFAQRRRLIVNLNGRHVEIEEMFERSDFVSIHVALSRETRHLVNANLLQRMQPTAVLVNTARGEVIDQSALVSALINKQLFAAGLDVCDPEPLPTDHPLLSLPNCIVFATHRQRHGECSQCDVPTRLAKHNSWPQ